MRVPIRWLREFVDVSASGAEIAERLTMAGIEVSSLAPVGAEWERVVIGRVQEIGRHENADNLFVASVDLGGERIPLVTAASNLKAGDVAPVIRAGGRLASDRPVEARRFRGVLSEGMLCSGDELGISPDKDTIYVLEAEAPVGMNLVDYLGDEVLDIDLKPNRPDCLGVVGVAREVAALFGLPFRSPDPAPIEGDRPVEELVQVFVDDPDLCPRYTAAYLAGARIGPSPPWLQRRLYLCGVRAISNVVDATNYVMLELGQPLHAFDADRLRDATIRVRRAREGEGLTTIDGEERRLASDHLAIADATVPVALAGVMGGANSEVADSTTNILLESASFSAASIRRTSRELRLWTEASRRFDKGLDEELPPLASGRAMALMVQLAGGSPARGLVDVRRPPEPPRAIRFTPSDLAGLIGLSYPPQQINAILGSLGFQVRQEGASFEAIVPSWRGDVDGKADIAEEVARVAGYESIPTVLPSGHLPRAAEEPTLRWTEVLRSALAAAGLQEVITYSLIGPHDIGKLDASRPHPAPQQDGETIPVFNPMSADQSRLRTTLLPSLLATVSSNLRFGRRVAIFEMARSFHPPMSPLPGERRRLGVAMAGVRSPEGWSADSAPLDFYDLKAGLEAGLRALGLGSVVYSGASGPWLHPGRGAAARVEEDDSDLGLLGQVHPRVAERFEIEGVDVYAAEIDLDLLLSHAREEIAVQALPRFPGVERDLAIVVEERFDYAEVAARIRAAGGGLLTSLTLFDVYRGPQVPEGHRSLAYSLTFRSPERTLAEDEVGAAMDAIERELAGRFGARVRGRPTS